MASVLLTDRELEKVDALADTINVDKSVVLAEFPALARQAYRRYLVFSKPPIVDVEPLASCSMPDAFYNAYYWFLIFVKQYQAHVGPDAGLEQQAFQMIEQAPEGVDWQVMESIAKSAMEFPVER